MLQKHYWIIAADGRAQEAIGIERIGWKHHPHSGGMSEDALAALGVVDGAASEVSPDGDADDRRAGKTAVGAPADERQLVAELLHCWPYVIEELDFNYRLEAPGGHAHGPPYNIGFGEW